MAKNIKTPYVIGLVGKAGSGKSTVARILADEYGFAVIALDAVGHEALELSREELVTTFGPSILSEEGTIQRSRLSEIVFKDMDKLITLNAITHPKIKNLVKERLKSIQNHTLLDGALLYEIGLAPFCDLILMVDAPESDILYRLTHERQWSKEKARSVLYSQRHLQFLKEQADFIIFNNDGIEKIRRQIDFFVNALA